jgi:transcriptional regulator with XRE-family HTH domain
MTDHTTVQGGSASEPSLAERLKARREVLGISQSQAARELDVARTAYRLWELEAARPSPDRWRLVARWLGVSMTTLLLAEGLITPEAEGEADLASERYEAAMGETWDVATEREQDDFFRQAQSFIDRSVEKGLVTADEAGHFRELFERIEAASPSRRSGRSRQRALRIRTAMSSS